MLGVHLGVCFLPCVATFCSVLCLLYHSPKIDFASFIHWLIPFQIDTMQDMGLAWACCPMCPPALAIPKSPIFRLPLLQMKKFPDFKSRCKTCLSWHRMDWNLLERRIDWEHIGRCFRCLKTPQKKRRHSCTDRLGQKFDCVRTLPRVIQQALTV